MKGVLVKRKDRWDLYGLGGGKIASSLDWNTKLSIKNCQSIELGYDLDELADEWLDYNGHKWSNNDDTAGDNYCSFKAGFQKALDLMSDKKYTNIDLIGAIAETWLKKKTTVEIIKSLQQTEWDVEIITEPMNLDEIREQGKGFLNADTNKPKLDVDGCLILKRAELDKNK